MTEEQLNNIDKPQGWDVSVSAQDAIHAINRLLWSDDVVGDDYAEPELCRYRGFPNIPVPVKHSKTIPVMETTIEGAQKRIKPIIEWYDDYPEGNPWGTDLEYIGVFIDSVGDEMAAISSSCNSLHDRYVEALANANQLQADFDTVDAEAANHLADKIKMQKAIDEWKDNFESVSVASARRLEEKIELQKEVDRLREERDDLLDRVSAANTMAKNLRQANLNLIHAANDNR